MDQQNQSLTSWFSRYWPVVGGSVVLLLVIAAGAGVNVFGVLPYLLIPGLCILMHLFMHGGHSRGSDDHHRPSDR